MGVQPLPQFLYFPTLVPYTSTSCLDVIFNPFVDKHEKNRLIAVKNAKQMEVIEDVCGCRAIVKKVSEKGT
jgi:hypothetical protein